MALYWLLCFVIVSADLINADADTPEEYNEIRIALIKQYMEDCKQQYGVSHEMWVEAKKAKNFENINKCAIACFYKKMGYINDKGLLDVAHAKDMASKRFSTDEEKKVVYDLWDHCAYVNDEKYSDGEMGCDLSAELITCLLKHSVELIK